MEEEKTIRLSGELERFISDFQKSFTVDANRKADNDKVIGSALVYEKIRTALEYQEEHLIFKNAIARIMRRKYTLMINPTADQLVSDLISELAWANYINPEAIKPEEYDKITSIVKRYMVCLKFAKSGHINKPDLQKMLIGWMSCEINEIFHPSKERDVFLDFVTDRVRNNLSLQGSRVSEEDNDIQLKLAIYSLVLKPDYYLLQYWLLKTIYPNWSDLSEEEIKKIARSFDPYYNKLDHALNHPNRKNYLIYVKRNIAPFTLLYRVLVSEKIDLAKIKEKPHILHTLIMERYDKAIRAARDKVWRGTIRALIFILFTKISLAFLLEIPFDRLFEGGINYVTLIINVTLPPLLMLVSGTFVKSPPVTNYKTVSDAVNNLISKGAIQDKKFSLIKRKNTFLEDFFSYAYLLVTLAILVGAIWLLLYLKFNILSIILFFVFVSAVSFFSFRIRNIALELAMKRSKDDAITSSMELIFLPFIRIGRYLSDRIAAFNPFILALDFIIEAPLKTIIKLTNSWLRFINSKKEDLEF
jgi:hypothetical protein